MQHLVMDGNALWALPSFSGLIRGRIQWVSATGHCLGRFALRHARSSASTA